MEAAMVKEVMEVEMEEVIEGENMVAWTEGVLEVDALEEEDSVKEVKEVD